MVCRLCLAEIEKSKSILIYSEENIHKCIARFLQLQISPEDPFSKVICSNCWETLNSFQSFYLKIEHAQQKLNNVVDKLKEKEPTKEDVINSELNDRDDGDDIQPCVEENSINNKFQNDVTMESVQLQKTNRRSRLQKTNHISLSDKIKQKRKKTKLLEDEQFKMTQKVVDQEHIVTPKSDHPPVKDEQKTSENKVSRSEKYSKHMKTSKEYDAIILKNMNLSCDICSEANFADFSKLKLHFRAVHKCRGYAVCCNKKLNKRGLIVDHINLHQNPEQFKCTECGKVMSDRSCLQRHIISFHPTEELKTFECDHCHEKFGSQYLLNQHTVKHFTQNDFLCSDCGKGFPTSSTLNEHCKRRHSTVYDRMCEICAKLIRGKGAFERHMKEHEGVVQPQAQCKECGSWLKDKNSLRKHIYSKHDGKTHNCTICGKNTPSKSALYSHIKYMHQLSRMFHCTFCDKSFKKAIHLKEHTTIHTGEVLYTCPHCPTTFNAKANMHSHRKKMHRQDWEANKRCDKKEPNSDTK